MALPLLPLLNETVADMMIQYFKDNFNANLAEVDNQYSDGINLEPIKDESIYITDKIETLQLPSMFLLFGEMAFNYTGEQNYIDATNQCVCVISCEDVDSTVLVRKAWRYARVLQGIFNQVDLGDLNDRVEIHINSKRLGYSDERVSGKLDSGRSAFRKDCVLELEIMHFEKTLT